MAENSIIKDDQNLEIAASTSETLATQGNVINSLISFWGKLKAKLNLAVTRDTSKAIGSEYIPVYVNEDGEVKECNTEIIGITSVGNSSLEDNKIKLNATGTNPSIKITVKPVIGTMVYLSLPNYSSNNATELRIQDGSNVSSLVYYTSGSSVQVKDLAGQAAKYLLVYSKDDANAGRWIVLNKLQEATSTEANDTSGDPDSIPQGKAGLMSAYDKAKLNSIQWGATKFTFSMFNTMPAATTDSLGGVCLGDGKKNNNISTLQGTGNINKYYPVTADKDNKLVVNVPWQNDTNTHYKTDVAVGDGTTTKSVQNNPKVAIFENNNGSLVNNSLHSFQIAGGNNITVESDANNVITIKGQAGVPPYNADDNAGQILAVNVDGNGMEWRDENSYVALSSSNKTTTGSYLVSNPGNIDTTNYLNANGEWSTPIKQLYAGANKSSGVLSVNSTGTDFTGTLNLKTATSTTNLRFCIIGKDGKVYSSNGTGGLDVSGKLDTPPSNGGVMYVPYFITENFRSIYRPGVFKLQRASSGNSVTVTVL